MIEKCQLASDEIAAAEVLNPSTVSGIVNQMESLKVSRMIVTDQSGMALYDSGHTTVGSYVLLPEILHHGGRIVLSSDAHQTENIAFWFDQAAELLRANGFTSIVQLRGGTFEEVGI